MALLLNLEKSHYQDHWICEYWEAREGRWVMEDADLKLHDLSESDFITAARAWQLCREGFTEASKFGFGPDHDERGVWVVRGNLVHDFAALNGFECVSGDCWGLAGKLEADISSEDRDILDSAARLAVLDERFDARCTLYEQNKGLYVPDQIWSVDYVLTGKSRPIAWKDAP